MPCISSKKCTKSSLGGSVLARCQSNGGALVRAVPVGVTWLPAEPQAASSGSSEAMTARYLNGR